MGESINAVFSLFAWLRENAATLDRAYAGELDPHFRVRG
jgi:hypothetical protein